MTRLGGKSSLSVRYPGVTRAALVSGDSDTLAYSNGNAVALGALSADFAPTTDGFPVDNGEFDLDRPTEGFASIPEAIEDIRQGKVENLFFREFKASRFRGILFCLYHEKGFDRLID